ncbi:MAG: DNA polymerase Y family protein [Thermoleophilaceae bacterium]
MIVCVLILRFSLRGALGGAGLPVGEPAALAPEAGREQSIGEVSQAAEGFGVAPGMRVGEAIARCPGLRLIPPDPEGVRTLWAKTLDRLESVGAAVESDAAGTAFFEAQGLRGIHGGSLEGVLAATRRALEKPAPRLGAAPSRFCAYAAARANRPRKGARVVRTTEAPGFLAPLPVALLRERPELAWLPETLMRLGVRTLGELAALPRTAVAERFGHPGLFALRLAQGEDTPLDPRRPPEPVAERLELPEAASGIQLERALELLVGRVLARPERRGRTLRSLALSARFVAGGTWRTRVTLRQASADGGRIRLALGPRLAELPAPADTIGLEVEAFGPPAHDQSRLLDDGRAARRRRLDEAVRQARQAAGPDAAMRLLEVDPDSRVPERRNLLMPFESADPSSPHPHGASGSTSYEGGE